MSVECGPWHSCDYHQYRSWLRRAEPATGSTPAAAEKEPRQKPRRGRRRPMPGDYQLVFRHQAEVEQYERDYLAQVTHARCRVAHPHATLPPPPAEPHFPPNADPPEPAQAAAPGRNSADSPSSRLAQADLSTASIIQTTESTPDLSTGTASPAAAASPQPASTPELCQLPPIERGPPSRLPAHRRAVLGPVTAAVASRPGKCDGRRRVPINASTLRMYDSSERPELASHTVAVAGSSSSSGGGGGGSGSGGGGVLRARRPPAVRQPSTASMVTLDLPSPYRISAATPVKRGWAKQPRGLTKIQFATPVPENLTIIVGRKLEICLGGAKKAARGRGFR